MSTLKKLVEKRMSENASQTDDAFLLKTEKKTETPATPPSSMPSPSSPPPFSPSLSPSTSFNQPDETALPTPFEDPHYYSKFLSQIEQLAASSAAHSPTSAELSSEPVAPTSSAETSFSPPPKSQPPSPQAGPVSAYTPTPPPPPEPASISDSMMPSRSRPDSSSNPLPKSSPKHTQSFTRQPSASPEEKRTFRSIPLKMIYVDLGQVRPAIPRNILESHNHNPFSALKAAIAQANEDIALKQSMQAIYELSEDIKKNGLIHPIGVIPVYQGDTIHSYRIIYGERRFFAKVLIALEKGTEETETIDALVFEDDLPHEQQIFLQWSENLKRTDIPQARIAQIMLHLFTQTHSELQQNPSYEHLSIRDLDRIAYELTSERIKALTGQNFSIEKIRNYVSIAEKLSDYALTMAIKANLPIHVLERISRLSRTAQDSYIKKMLDGESPPLPTSPTKRTPARFAARVQKLVMRLETMSKQAQKQRQDISPEEAQSLIAFAQTLRRLAANLEQLAQEKK